MLNMQHKLLFTNWNITGLPLVLHHSNVIRTPATILSIIGGVLIYTTVVLFTSFFDDSEEDEFAI